jgi:hypothetical protein
MILFGATSLYLVVLMFKLTTSLNFVYLTSEVSHKLYKKRNSVNVRANFFTERIVSVWNSLPNDIVNFETLPTFKRTIKLIDLSMFLKCF